MIWGLRFIKIESGVGIKEIEVVTAPPPKAKPTLLKSLLLELNDPTTVSEGANEFLAEESRFDIPWKNAHIAQSPVGSSTTQGYEAHTGVNCLGLYLFTWFLALVIIETA